jgi:2-keto-4-pentenoate hydratase/2-oxohepta-3-ene-1,7-dioic acid hydratase in catechol pathway
MRYCRIVAGGRPRWGRIADDVIHLLRDSPLPGTTVVGAGPAGAGAAGAGAGGAGAGGADGEVVPLAGAVFLPPVVPAVFYAVGLNYRAHAEHYGAAIPDRPEVGYRANNALTGHGSPIVRPDGVEGRFEAEPELVAVIGRTLRRASRDEARDGIFGWTVGNDVSARAWQHADRTFWRSKNSDTFKPMGPWIETSADPLSAGTTTTLRVDGEVRAAFPTGAMIFDPYEFIAEITRYITMQPGDVLWMGADATCQLEPGTVVDVEISGIGTLTNPVEAEKGGR